MWTRTRSTPPASRFPKAKKFTDFRKMLDEMGKSIDAVTVSTPDHCHAVMAALMAMKMGKHCFCQKPLTHTIYEARLMGEIARDKKVATQMGNQGTARRAAQARGAVQRQALGQGQRSPRLDQPADLAARRQPPQARHAAGDA